MRTHFLLVRGEIPGSQDLKKPALSLPREKSRLGTSSLNE